MLRILRLSNMDGPTEAFRCPVLHEEDHERADEGHDVVHILHGPVVAVEFGEHEVNQEVGALVLGNQKS